MMALLNFVSGTSNPSRDGWTRGAPSTIVKDALIGSITFAVHCLPTRLTKVPLNHFASSLPSRLGIKVSAWEIICGVIEIVIGFSMLSGTQSGAEVAA
jgi:hypothetical protein